MKQLELSLQKRLLILESEKIELSQEGVICKDANSHLSDLIEGNFELICKGSELTEELAGEYLVHGFDLSYYVDYNHHNARSYKLTALDSFISAIEAQGYYWGENPFKKELDRCNEYTDMFTIAKRTRNYEEAESRTFNTEKTLIFKIV